MNDLPSPPAPINENQPKPTQTDKENRAVQLFDRFLRPHPIATLSGVGVLGLLVGAVLRGALHPIVGPLFQLINDAGPGIEALATVVIAGYTWSLLRATEEMQKATTGTLDHIRKEFDAEHRPWISVKVEPHLPFEFGPDGTGFTRFMFSFENTGRTPAIEVRTYYRVVPPSRDAVAEQRAIAQAMLAGTIVSPELGISVFPGSPASQSRHYIIPVDVFGEWRHWWDSRPHTIGTEHTHIVGCTTYRSPLGGTVHQTGFIRELHHLVNDGLHPIEPKKSSRITHLYTSGSILGSGAIT